LAGAVGTALGGGVGAALSSKDDPRPALAGLPAGPLLGIATGGVLVPRLRTSASSSSPSGDCHALWSPGRKVAGFSAQLGDSTISSDSHQVNSADAICFGQCVPASLRLGKPQTHAFRGYQQKPGNQRLCRGRALTESCADYLGGTTGLGGVGVEGVELVGPCASGTISCTCASVMPSFL
jgi:hypothetical protein